MDWLRVAASAEVDTRPRRVEASGQALVVVRLADDGPVSVFADQCPHRMLPLSAGRVVGGRLQCGYHGWGFDTAGRCTQVPSMEAGAAIPPRAALRVPGDVREADGSVWFRPGPTADEEPAPPSLTNTDPALRRGWHAVALSTEVATGETAVRLLGDDWLLRRDARDGCLQADPVPYAVRELRGVIWLAPAEPMTDILEVPEDTDPGYPGRWMTPARTTSPAGLMADNFLDVAHFPFVHTSTFGAGQDPEVPAFDVHPEPGGFRSVQEQWFANPEDPGVLAGLRPVRQRRRA
ncbi:MAG: Rieske 2Fe-2S domain-containing protein, partial [Mycobacteriales bacterium]